jgi:hypothetical protein
MYVARRHPVILRACAVTTGRRHKVDRAIGIAGLCRFAKSDA